VSTGWVHFSLARGGRCTTPRDLLREGKRLGQVDSASRGNVCPCVRESGDQTRGKKKTRTARETMTPPKRESGRETRVNWGRAPLGGDPMGVGSDCQKKKKKKKKKKPGGPKN